MRAALFIACLIGLAAPAAAEVTNQSPTGFTATQVVPIQATAAEAFEAFLALPGWWDRAHSYTGDASNLSLDPQVGGCWCERFPDGGGVEHMRVIYIVPDGGPIRLRGGLGPLQPMGASGVMTVDFEDSPDGFSSIATLTYIVTGPAGTGEIAGPVDGVLGDAMTRLADYAAGASLGD